MTAKERVLAAIQFKPFDRVPYWDTAWGGFEQSWQKAIPKDNKVRLADYYHNEMYDELSSEEPFFLSERRKLSENDEYEIWNNGWGTVVQQGKQNATFEHCIERKLSSCADVAQMEFEPVEPDVRYESVLKMKEQNVRKGRCCFSKVGGIYIRSTFLRGEPELLMDMAMDPDGVHLLFDKVAKHLTGIALQSLARLNTWDTGLFIADDMAGIHAPMFNPGMFETFLLPLYTQMIKQVKAAGCQYVFFHSDGNIGPLINLLLEAGFDGFNPLEPRCGQDLFSLRKQYGNQFVCFGGVCNTEILPRGDLKEIEAHVRPLLELAQDGGIILGTASIGDDIDPCVYDQYRKLIDQYA